MWDTENQSETDPKYYTYFTTGGLKQAQFFTNNPVWRSPQGGWFSSYLLCYFAILFCYLLHPDKVSLQLTYLFSLLLCALCACRCSLTHGCCTP